MKFLIIPIIVSLSACSTCQIPHVRYGSQGGTENSITLDLKTGQYSLLFERWEPGGYENRFKEKQLGRWSCVGNSAEFITKQGVSNAKYKEIGKNPLGLPETTKALVFMRSKDDILSNEILYPLEMLN